MQDMAGSQAKTARLQGRTAKRAATAERKKKAAEILKDKGNAHYRRGEYEDAAKCYEDAILGYGPRAVYMNNLSAALLKLERYEEAEATASHALRRDHKLLKARFRRGLARKNQGYYRSAIIDFENALKQNPKCEEARIELKETKELYESVGHSEDKSDELEQDSRPLYDEPNDGYETGYTSDSIDFFHVGNDTPCRFYNHNGCSHGAQCKFKHAPDYRSVRDRLGRNVCALYLIDLCEHPASSCWYTHDKTYLPPIAWDKPERAALDKRAVQLCMQERALLKLDPYMQMLNLNGTGPMFIPRLRRETFNANRQYRSRFAGILDYEPDVDEIPDWESMRKQESRGRRVAENSSKTPSPATG